MTSLRSTITLPLLVVGAALIGTVACGDNYGPPLDDDNNDDVVTLSSCEKFASPAATVDTYPAVYDGSLALATSALNVSAGSCAVEEAPFGVDTPGPDTVVALTNLNPGQEYVLRLYSQSDLAMYVATDCDEQLRGPAAGSCLLFTDDTVQPPERGTFVAPASGEATLIIDYFLNAPPVVAEFSLDVYEAECSTDDECTGGNGFCVDNRCVECATSFDCEAAGSPICNARTNTCVAGDNTCTDDEDGEGYNDGPAGATDVTPGAEPTVVNGTICNSPQSELDFFKFTVDAGESVTLELDWAASLNKDLDFAVFDSTGRQIGASLWKRPEVIELSYLPAGTYYASVNLFGGNVTSGQPYTVTATKTSTDACVDASDCAVAYDTQLYRGDCQEDGACHRIANETPAELGAVCDSGDDCDSGLCSAFSFTSDADLRAVCSSSCSTDADCSELGDFVCTDYLISNMCVPKCETDAQCAVLIGNQPTCPENDTSCLLDPPVWEHLTCNTDTGRCEF